MRDLSYSTSRMSLPIPHDGRYTLRLKHKDGTRIFLRGTDGLTGLHSIMAEQDSRRRTCTTIQGSPDALRRILSSTTKGQSNLISFLSIDHASPDTIGRLVNASLQHEIDSRYRGTIGLNVTFNQYFCCKPNPCIVSMLSYLADFSNTANIVKPFSLRLLLTTPPQDFEGYGVF